MASSVCSSLWAQWRQQRAERRQFADVPDFAALRELTARWCLGELSWSAVGQPAPRDTETVEIGEALAAINRAGMLTTHSQPAQTFEWGVQQRAFVEGYCTAETEERIRHLIAGTRLRIATQVDAGWLNSYKGAAPATRHRTAEGEWVESRHGQFGARLSADAMDLEFRGIPGHVYDELNEMARITLWDPQWEPSDLLFRRLSVPDWDNPPPLREEDRAMPTNPPTSVPTDEEVEQLSQNMEAAFAERDRLMAVWTNSGTDDDEESSRTAMEAQDRHAARLLDQYNAACRAQYAESDRRRDLNVARHGRDQAAGRGDLAEALQGDDWLEDHGMHADERRTCFTCQSWADHAHDPLTGRRYELGEDDVAAEVNVAKARAAGIPVYHCDNPACDCEKPGRWWTREAREGRQQRRRETWAEVREAWARNHEQDSAPTTSGDDMTTHGQEARSRWDCSRTGRAVNNVVDAFFKRLFRDWGNPGTVHWAPKRPPTSKAIRAAVDAKLAERQAIDSIAVAPQPVEPDDTRPQPEPQNLDNLTPPPPPAAVHSGAWSAQYLKVDLAPEWCNCGWMAGAHRHDHSSALNVRDLLSPPPSTDAAPDPSSPTN